MLGLGEVKIDVVLGLRLAHLELGAGFLVLQTPEELIGLDLVSLPDETLLEDAPSGGPEDRRPFVFQETAAEDDGLGRRGRLISARLGEPRGQESGEKEGANHGQLLLVLAPLSAAVSKEREVSVPWLLTGRGRVWAVSSSAVRSADLYA